MYIEMEILARERHETHQREAVGGHLRRQLAASQPTTVRVNRRLSLTRRQER
jgi:hypothetical protein